MQKKWHRVALKKHNSDGTVRVSNSVQHYFAMANAAPTARCNRRRLKAGMSVSPLGGGLPTARGFGGVGAAPRPSCTKKAPLSESARKVRFSSPARSGQSLGCFAKRRVPADGVRGRGGIPGDEPKLTSLWPALNPSFPVPKPNPLHPSNPSKPVRPFGAIRVRE